MVPVVLWQQVHVVKDEAVKVVVLFGLLVSDIHEGSSVEVLVRGLLDNHHPVVKLLPLENRVDVT